MYRRSCYRNGPRPQEHSIEAVVDLEPRFYLLRAAVKAGKFKSTGVYFSGMIFAS
jgi:hypothetical protein